MIPRKPSTLQTQSPYSIGINLGLSPYCCPPATLPCLRAYQLHPIQQQTERCYPTKVHHHHTKIHMLTSSLTMTTHNLTRPSNRLYKTTLRQQMKSTDPTLKRMFHFFPDSPSVNDVLRTFHLTVSSDHDLVPNLSSTPFQRRYTIYQHRLPAH